MEKRDPILIVSGLSVNHGPVNVINDMSIFVDAGEIVALLGANGSGKSVLVETLVGMHRPIAGQVLWLGSSIGGLPTRSIVRMGISFVPEGRGVFSTLSVKENLLIGRDRRHRVVDERLILERFPILESRTLQRGATLSGGEGRMLVIARALMSGPKLLILDEPSIGLAPNVVTTVFETIARFRNDGISVLVAEQNASAALSIADRAYVLDRGRVVKSGTADEVADDTRIAEAYFGTEK